MKSAAPAINFKEILWVFGGLLGLLLLFFWDLFTVKVGFISGDHRVQHYPWMYYLAAELKAGRLPLWTDLIGCGFPIFAEGQIALLYPLNLLIYGVLGFLPFDFLYNYSTLSHYFLGGLFFYLFCRKLALSPWGSAIGTFIYLFGYCQGGYFYNMNSQKTVIWFPLILFLMEKFLKTKNWILLLWMGVLFGIQVNAGYLQIAFYSIAFAIFYFLIRFLMELKGEGEAIKKCGLFIASLFVVGGVTLAVSLPQLLATFELSRFSSRTHVPESFAYVGSLAPQGFLTLLLPFLDNFLGYEFYVSLLGIFLVLGAWMSRKEWQRPLWAVFWLGIFSLLIAMGQFSPLYIGLVKITHFYGFRVPSKTLYFLCFALSMLAAYGWDQLIAAKSEMKEIFRAVKLFAIIMIVGLAFCLTGEIIMGSFLPVLKGLGAWVVQKFYATSTIHPYSYEDYMSRLDLFLSKFLRTISLRESFWMKVWAGLLALHTLWAFIFLTFFKRARKWILGFTILLLGVDLYAYSFTSIRGSWEPYDRYFGSTKPFVEFLKKETEPFRIYEYSLDLKREERFPLMYNLNMRYGIGDIGIYSPLALNSHRKFFKGIGANSDSLFVSLADSKSTQVLKPLLDLTNVKYLLSEKPPLDPAWEERLSLEGFTLYENLEVLPQAFWMPLENTVESDDFNAYARSGAFNPERQLVITKGGIEKVGPGSLETTRSLLQDVRFKKMHPDVIRIETNFSERGWLFLSQIFYPGWKVRVDGKEVPIWKANGIFQAVLIEGGRRRVEWKYQPLYKPFLWLPLIVISITLILSFIRPNR